MWMAQYNPLSYGSQILSWLCLGVLLIASCTLPPPPEVPLVVVAPPVGLPPEPQVIFAPSPIECVQVVSVAAILDTPMPPPPAKRPKAPLVAKPQTPAQVVQEAAKEAVLVPEKRGYFAGSGEYTYVYQPSKVYTIMLSSKAATFLLLPPGEVMVAGLYLAKDDYDVTTKRAGTDLLAYDVISIRPTLDKGEIDSAIVTRSGRRYLLHLVTGLVGMLAVTWETPAIHQEPDAPTLRLPKETP